MNFHVLTLMFAISMICCSKDSTNIEYLGNIDISSQSDIESIKVKLEGKKKISGNLVINNQNNSITDLATLSNIVEIKGDLQLLYFNSPLSFDGLQNLVTIGGLKIQYLENFEEKEFNKISNVEIKQSIEIEHTEVSCFPEFNNLKSISGYIRMFSNKKLKNINFLRNLESVGLDIKITVHDSLKNLDGLNKVHSTKELFIRKNENLEEISSTSFSLSVVDDITFDRNEKLENLSALENLTIINNELSISSNFKLTSIEGLRNLKSDLNKIYVGNNSELENFCPLKNVLSANDPDEVNITNNGIEITVDEIINNCP